MVGQGIDGWLNGGWDKTGMDFTEHGENFPWLFLSQMKFQHSGFQVFYVEMFCETELSSVLGAKIQHLAKKMMWWKLRQVTI